MHCRIMPNPVPSLASIAEDTPLRLNGAAALAFPDGSMSASGLRREATRSSLVIGLQESNRIRGRRMRFATPAPARVS
jgi:hypothetical protein